MHLIEGGELDYLVVDKYIFIMSISSKEVCTHTYVYTYATLNFRITDVMLLCVTPSMHEIGKCNQI